MNSKFTLARRAPDLTLRMCLVIATLFWAYVSATTVARWDLLREAANGVGIAPPGVIAMACVVSFPMLWLLTVVSWRAGHDLARWPRLLVLNLFLAVVFGLGCRMAFILSAAWLKHLPLARAVVWSDGTDPARAMLLWGASVVEDAAQYLVLQGILAGAAFYARLKSEQTLCAQLAAQYDRARLQALRVQANPHFLFNTLSAIAALVRTRPGAAETMIVGLGDLFRASLLDRDVEYIPLQRELELGVQYLEIQKTRFESRLDYELRVDPEVSGALIPALLLQPLLENAAEHGLAGSDDRIEVRIGCDAVAGSRVRLTIHNRAGPQPAGSSSRHHGFGLDNVRERLRLAYGEDAVLDAMYHRDGWFQALVEFPVHTAVGRAT